MSGLLPVAGTAQVRRYVVELFRRHPRALGAAVTLHVAAALAGLVGPRLLGEMVEGLQHGGGAPVIDRLGLLIAGSVFVQAVLTRFAHLACLHAARAALTRHHAE